MQALLTGFALGVIYCAAAYQLYLRQQRKRKQAYEAGKRAGRMERRKL